MSVKPTQRMSVVKTVPTLFAADAAADGRWALGTKFFGYREEKVLSPGSALAGVF